MGEELPEVVEMTEEEWAGVPHRRSFDICGTCHEAWPCPTERRSRYARTSKWAHRWWWTYWLLLALVAAAAVWSFR